VKSLKNSVRPWECKFPASLHEKLSSVTLLAVPAKYHAGIYQTNEALETAARSFAVSQG